MTSVDIHAILLLTVLPITFLICLVCKRRDSPTKEIARPTLITSLVVFLFLSLFSHSTTGVNPALQCLICGVSLWCFLVFIRSTHIRHLFCLASVFSMYAFAYHCNVVNDQGWIGQSSGTIRMMVLQMVQEENLERLRNEIKTDGTDDQTHYPSGWLRDVMKRRYDDSLLPSRNLHRFDIASAWHSQFTGLFNVRKIPLDVWYPGGTLLESAGQIEFRDSSYDNSVPFTENGE